jgi:hypothetical protein
MLYILTSISLVAILSQVTKSQIINLNIMQEMHINGVLAGVAK